MEAAKSLLLLSTTNSSNDGTTNNKDLLAKDEEITTSLTMKGIQDLEDRCKDLQIKNEELRSKLQKSSLTYESFKGDDDKVLFYTGLPNFEILQCLVNFISPILARIAPRRQLTCFQQLLLTLMKLRLNLGNKDLSYRYQLHESTVSRVFGEVLEVLYVNLKPLIVWPDRDLIKQTLPMDFRRHCPECVVIIDCFEIFIERPDNLLARAQTFSAYKHHNTVKYLIGITPQGSVSFISEGWGGRTSDKLLTQHSRLLTRLNPGDVILADRGFDIKELVGLYCARISIPSFTKGKKQLEGIEVDQTRKIANLRIHVERVIGNVRQKYKILEATQPIDYVSSVSGFWTVTTLDKIVTVTCGLVNLCDSVVPFE